MRVEPALAALSGPKLNVATAGTGFPAASSIMLTAPGAETAIGFQGSCGTAEKV